ncbi:uncharacterized protein TNCV_1327281 [Trichonephila clavipes]|nr:uncharacterized protein TNCV_1327281 [Trichonephila clavipes]
MPLVHSNSWDAQLATPNDFRYARLETNLGIGQAKSRCLSGNTCGCRVSWTYHWAVIVPRINTRVDRVLYAMAPHTVTPVVGVVCRYEANAGLRRSPWVEFPRARHHSKRRCRWVGVKDSPRNGPRDPKCPSAKRLRMVRKDTGAPSEGATCAWMVYEAAGCTRAFFTMWRSSRRLVCRGRPEPGLRVNDISRIHWSQHLLRTQFESWCKNCVKNWFQCCLPDDDQIDESSSINENRESSSPEIPPIAIHQLSNIETGKDLKRSKIPRFVFPSSSQMQASTSKSGMGDEIDYKSMKTNIARFTSNNESFIDTSYNNQKSNNTLTTNKDYAETIRNDSKNRKCIITIPEKIEGNKFISVSLNDLRPEVNQKLNDKDNGNTRFMKEKATQYQQMQNIENLVDERAPILLKNTSPGNRGEKTSKCTTGRSNDSMTSLFKYYKNQYVSEWIQKQMEEQNLANHCQMRATQQNAE